MVHSWDKQTRDPFIEKQLRSATRGLNLHRKSATVAAAITRGPCCASGRVRSCSVSHSVSHSAHSVTPLDLSGKQDVRKANSDERAFLGMKMKKELEKYASRPTVSTTCSALFFQWVILNKWWKLRRMNDWTRGLHELCTGGHMVRREHLRLDVTQGLLNLAEPRENTLRKWALYLLLLPQLAVKDISSRRKPKSLSSLYLLWVSLKSGILTSTPREDLLL